MIQMLARNWWAIAIRGACAVVFGLLALFMPGVTLEVLIIIFGAYAIVDGVFAIVAAVRAAERHERWSALVAEGVVGIITGLIAWFAPAVAALGFLYLFAAWALITGIMEITAAIELRRHMPGEWLLILQGVLSIALGVLLAAFPGPGLITLVWWIGIYAIVFGVLLIALAFRLRGMVTAAGSPAHP